MEEIRLTTWDVQDPVNNGIFTISTGAGFLPSTVVIKLEVLVLVLSQRNPEKEMITLVPKMLENSPAITNKN